jgi:hypothetical protein
MTITEKVKQAANSTLFTLYKEGIFYKCYNEDAMIFTKRVKNYKVNSKFVKSIGTAVYSLGFPVSEVAKGNLSLENVSEIIGAKSFEENNGNIVFSLNVVEIKKDYEGWKNTLQEGIIEVVKEPAALYQLPPDTAGIISMIKNFDLANSTPMQGLTFIQQLKMVLHKVEENNGNI